jgi:predicted kinase
MDSIRKRLMPGSVQSKADRVVAYRAMEFVASTLLTHGVPVILNATFGPLEHRREIIDISKELSVPIYLVECKVEPTTAVHRFESRHEPHPAVDLTAERVALLAQTFSYSGAGLLLDTSIDDIKSCLESVSVYLSHGDPIRSAEWLTPVCR